MLLSKLRVQAKGYQFIDQGLFEKTFATIVYEKLGVEVNEAAILFWQPRSYFFCNELLQYHIQAYKQKD